MHASIINRVAAALLLALLAILLARAVGAIGGDFHVFYLSGERLRAGLSLYQQSDGWMPYKYHPAWAALFSVFTVLPESSAYLVFNAAQLACWCWAAIIWMRWLGYSATNFVALFLVFLFAANMISIELRLGQVNGFLLLGATLVVDWMEREPPRWLTASATAAILTSLKLNFGLLAVYCLIKDVRSAFGFIAVAIVFHIVVLVSGAGGIDLYREWMTLLFAQSSEQYLSFDAQGVFRPLYAVLGAGGARMAWTGLVVLFIAGGVVLHRRRAARTDVAAYWIAGTYLLSPLAWWYQALFMFPMIAVLLHDRIAQWERWSLLAIVATWAVLGSDILGHRGFDGFKDAGGVLIMSLIVFALFLKRRLLGSAAAVQRVTLFDTSR